MLVVRRARPTISAARARVWSAVLTASVLVALSSACGLGDVCNTGEIRCNGAAVERCYADPGGYTVANDPPSVHKHKKGANYWRTETQCASADLCISPPNDTPFCAVRAGVNPACPTGKSTATVCDGQTLTECRDGFVVESQRCRACDVSKASYCDFIQDDCCTGLVAYSSCTKDADCAPGASCVTKDPKYPARCEIACGCADGTPCAPCDASLHVRAGNTNQGASFSWVCQAGYCAEKYQ